MTKENAYLFPKSENTKKSKKYTTNTCPGTMYEMLTITVARRILSHF